MGAGDEDDAGDGGEDAEGGQGAGLVAGEEGGGDGNDGAAGGDGGGDGHGAFGEAAVEEDQGAAASDPGGEAPGDLGAGWADGRDRQGGGEGEGAGQLAPEGDGEGGQAAGLDAAEEVRGPPAETGAQPERDPEVQEGTRGRVSYPLAERRLEPTGEVKAGAGGVLEARAGVGGKPEGGQVDGEQGEHEPEQFHGRSRFLSGSTSEIPVQ